MCRRQLADAARGRADHQRHTRLAAEHVVDLGGVVDDLVDRHQDEVDRHDLNHRPQAKHGCAGGQADKPFLGDRRVDHALLAKFALQALGDAVGALELTDLLTHQQDVGVARQLLAQRGVQRLAIVNPWNGWRPLPLCRALAAASGRPGVLGTGVAYIKSNSSSILGSGLLSAKSIASWTSRLTRSAVSFSQASSTIPASVSFC